MSQFFSCNQLNVAHILCSSFEPLILYDKSSIHPFQAKYTRCCCRSIFCPLSVLSAASSVPSFDHLCLHYFGRFLARCLNWLRGSC